MYSENQQDFESSVKEIREELNNYTNFVKRFEVNYQRRDQWVRLYRLGTLYRNNETNNYAEASIRIIKDIILSRTKAYNAVALVDFIVHVGEEYFTLRLLDHAHGRYRATHRLYSKLCSKMSDINKDDIKQVDTNTYTIPSQSDSTIIYSINTEIGVCSCKSGISGAFCKHQAWIHHEFQIQLPNSFAITMEERYALGKIALGDKCPPPEFFLGLKEQLITSINENGKNFSIIPENTKTNKSYETQRENIENLEEEGISLVYNLTTQNSTADVQIMDVSNVKNQAVETVSQEWNRLQNMIPSLPLTILEQLCTRLKNIQNSQQFVGFIHSVNKTAASLNRRKGKIGVQPTSISRRKQGVTRGSKRVPSGRRPKEYVTKRKPKRPNNLGKNLSNNVMNSKRH
jgi:hypothetical protein